MAITTYKSSDASAPSIARAAGDLITLLDAVLVNGYGSKSAAGWTKEYSGTNKAVYKQGTGSSGKYLRVVDDGTDYCGGAVADIQVSDGASGIDTVTGVSIGATTATYYIHKPDSVANRGSWVMYADSKAFYLLTQRAPTTAVTDSHVSYSVSFFGDAISYAPTTDAYRFFTLSDQSSSPSSSVPLYSMSTTALGGVPGGFHGDPSGRWDNGITTYLCSGHPGFMDQVVYPSYIAKGLLAFPVYLVHSSVLRSGPEVRGRLPGVFVAPFSSTSQFYIKNGDSFTFSSGDLNGKTLEARYILGGGAYGGRLALFETSNTWGN
jgi:hypothetical protein